MSAEQIAKLKNEKINKKVETNEKTASEIVEQAKQSESTLKSKFSDKLKNDYSDETEPEKLEKIADEL